MMNASSVTSGASPHQDSHVMVLRTDRDGRSTYVSAAWLAFIGRGPDRALGSAWLDLVHPGDQAAAAALYRDHVGRRSPFETDCRIRRSDGAYRRVYVRGVPMHDDGVFAGFVLSCVEVDAPAWYDAYDAIAGGTEFFEMSLDNLCVAGFDGYFKRLNPAWTKTLGWTPEEMMARPSADFVHPDDRAATLAGREGLKNGKPLHALANRYLCKDGSYRWFEWRSVSNVERGLVYCVARDVTAEKDAQRALREATESLTATLNGIADGVIATHADATIARMNPVAERLTGWTSEEALGRPLGAVVTVVDACSRRATSADVVDAVRAGTGAATGANGALLVTRSGAEVPIALDVAPLHDAEGRVSGAAIVIRDRTAEQSAKELQERLQKQLMLADRMASVGTLAAGVAHEINNPLTYVMANIDLLLEEVRRLDPPASPSWLEMAVEARQGTERIRKIVRGLKTFSRAEEERRAVFEVRPVVELSIDMAWNEIRHRARLVKDYGDVPRVLGDDARLGQVIINLLVNAAQAISEGSTDDHEIRIVTATDESGHAVIEVRDTGPGIPPNVGSRIFDPFFTTKPVGVGTGLGLSICHTIVTGMGGQISAFNGAKRGAVIRVVLPPAPPDAPSGSTMTNDGPAPLARRATVLVIDDERAVGITLGRVLRDHDVTVVTTAQEALALVGEGGPFDVILSDLMMPGMSGMELYDVIARQHPRAAERIVFITGGAFTPAANAFLDRVANERIEKPFDPATVRALVAKFVA